MTYFDLTGSFYLTMKKRFSGNWIINDHKHVLTNDNEEDVLTQKINKINVIQDDLNKCQNDVDYVNIMIKYQAELKDEFINQYLNIQLAKHTFNKKKITTKYEDYNEATIIHRDLNNIENALNINEEINIYFINLYDLDIYQQLKVFEFIKNHIDKEYVISCDINKIKDYMKFFGITRGFEEIKNKIYKFV